MNVWLVVSSYRNDAEVVALLDRVRPLVPGLFAHVLIVDSTGTGAIPQLLESQARCHITYSSYDTNLGSGANLCERLRLAAEAGADYAYAVNHDGNVDPDVVSTLLKVANSAGNLGAVYPLGLMTKARLYNLTGTRELPLPAKFVSSPPSAPLIDVFWSSSNGALYSLKPARQGILPWPAMWMGWEDLEYGWRLADQGYRQVMVSSAIYRDDHEYVQTWVGKTVDKPAWRTYYCFRNLLLAIRRSRNRPLYYAVLAYRVAIECGLIFLVRSGKWKRLRELVAGVAAGLTASLDENSESVSQSAPGVIAV
jgi:GT2 family glycosyltransferase